MITKHITPTGIKRSRKQYADTQRIMVDIETGEQSLQLPMSHSVEIYRDTVPYTKVFPTFWEVLPKLNSAGVKLLSYIGLHLDKDATSIQLTRETFLKWSGATSQVTFYNGIKNLITNGVLLKSSTNTYLINVNVLFNGDRTQLIHTKR